MGVLAEKPGASPQTHEQPGSPRRILAIDYGRRRIGLAISDELGITARPLAILVRKNRREDLKRLRDICESQSVGHILVGHPVHITGEAGDMAAEASLFAARIAKALGIESELVDERLTSWEARRTLSENAGRRDKREAVDDVAAAVLLRDYLEHRRERARAQPAERG